MNAKEDRDSDRYVEVSTVIAGERVHGGVFASPEEAVYAMSQMNTNKTKFEVRCYLKTDRSVMMSGRFMRAKRVRQLIGVSAEWVKTPVFKAPIRRRKKLDYYSAEKLISRLKTNDHCKKPLIVHGVSRRDVPPEHDYERQQIKAIMDRMCVVNQNE